MPEFHSPHSSTIKGARYDQKTKTLEIDFHRDSGGVDTYVYNKVPSTVWSGFEKAMSKGTYLHTHIIKDRAKPRFKGVKKQTEESVSSKDLQNQLRKSLGGGSK